MIINSKVFFSILASLLVGGMLFVPLVFSFGYSLLVAGIIVSILTPLICIGLALSSRCRCIMALVFPSFFTGKGRGVILSVIFGMMLTGSISHNVKETGRSMACFVDLLTNQTDTSQMPVWNSVNDVTQQDIDGRPLQNTTHAEFAVIEELLAALEKTSTVKKECKALVEYFVSHCNSTCTDSHSRHHSKGTLEDCVNQCHHLKTNVHSLCAPLNRSTDFKHIRSSLTMVEDIFTKDIEIQVRDHLVATDNVSNSIKSARANVNADIDSKVSDFQTVIHVLQKMLSLYTSLVFLKAYWYFINYLSKDWYGNIYITKQFLELDKLLTEVSGKGTLPLQKNEKKKYIYTLSLKLNKKEMKHCKKGLIQVFLHFIICSLILWVDYSLYYLLNLVRDLGKRELVLFGESGFHVRVNGTGPIAAFYRRLVNIEIRPSIAECLPDPLFTSGKHFAVMLGLYVFALCFVILRGYGMRLRRKIAAYYYPDQETARMEYLHKLIQHQRSAHRRFLRQNVMSTYKERTVRDNFRLSTRLLRRFPSLANFVSQQQKLECTSCELRQGILNSQLTKCSGVKDGWGCPAVYCEECRLVLNNICALCSSQI